LRALLRERLAYKLQRLFMLVVGLSEWQADERAEQKWQSAATSVRRASAAIAAQLAANNRGTERGA